MRSREKVGNSVRDQDLGFTAVFVGFCAFSARLHEHKAFTRMMSENLIKVRRSKALGKEVEVGSGWRKIGFLCPDDAPRSSLCTG